MLIRALVQISGSLGTFPAGTTADVDEVVAAAWIEAGIAEPVSAAGAASAPIEEAVISPPETAVTARRRGRR